MTFQALALRQSEVTGLAGYCRGSLKIRKIVGNKHRVQENEVR